MFGSGNEPTAIEFEDMFPLSYYSYNSGILKSITATAIETTGFNQWDEEWEVGAYDATTGEKITSQYTTFRCKNPIRVQSGASYYFRYGGTLRYGRILYLDGQGSVIGDINQSDTPGFLNEIISTERGKRL